MKPRLTSAYFSTKEFRGVGDSERTLVSMYKQAMQHTQQGRMDSKNVTWNMLWMTIRKGIDGHFA